MPFLKKNRGFLLLLYIAFSSCTSHEDRLQMGKVTFKIESVDSTINVYEGDSAMNEHLIDSFKLEKENQFRYSKVLRDSSDIYVEENPKAAGYIHEFDKDPIDILQEYVDASDNNARGKLLFDHLKLMAYAQAYSTHIDSLRIVLRNFDSQKKACIRKIRELQGDIDKCQFQINMDSKKIAGLKKRKYQLRSEN